MRIQRSKKYSRKCQTAHGGAHTAFTMVEVLVALVILGVTIIAVFGAMRNCSMAAHHTRMLTRSVLLAETLMAQTRTSEVTVFETKQGQEGSYSWNVELAPTPVENLGAVRVRVNWLEQHRPQQYELLSLIYMPVPIEGK